MRKSYSLLTTLIAAAGLIACDQLPTGQAQGGLHAVAPEEEIPADCAKGAPPAAAHAAPAAPRAVAPAKPARVDIELGSSALKGDTAAPVTIVVFSDFECPFCKRGAARIDELTAKYGRNVRIAFKNYPLPFHDDAPRAAAAGVAAQNQGRFWELHDRLFTPGAALDEEGLLAHARALGLDVERFQRDLDDPATKARVEADIAEAQRVGVQGTPTFFVNGERVVGAQPLAAFVPLIDQALAQR